MHLPFIFLRLAWWACRYLKSVHILSSYNFICFVTVELVFFIQRKELKQVLSLPNIGQVAWMPTNNLKGKDRIGLNILLPLKTRRVENVWRKKPRHNHDPTTDSQQNKGWWPALRVSIRNVDNEQESNLQPATIYPSDWSPSNASKNTITGIEDAMHWVRSWQY
jgi:hypothetical protein